MPRKINVAKPASVPAKPTKPTTTPRVVATGKPAKPAAAVATVKPAVASFTIATAPAGTLTVNPAAAAKPADTAAAQPRGLIRDAANINGVTDFSVLSDRDNAYLRFFGSVAISKNHACSVLDLHSAGIVRNAAKPNKRSNPFWAGSAKATDGDVYDRLAQAGFLTVSGPSDSASQRMLTATALAKASSHYNAKA